MAGPQGTTGGYGYGGFGSFFSGDVSELIRQPPEVYAAPPLPFSPPSIDPDLASRPFGHAFRKEFLINFEDWAFINHGAFGAVAEPVMEDAERWRRHCERQPLLHLDRCAHACVRARGLCIRTCAPWRVANAFTGFVT